MTIICVCGLRGSGKSTLSTLLQDSFGFIPVTIETASVKLKAEELKFSDCNEALEELTSRWTENFVISDILNAEDYDIFLKRPFTFVVEISSPLTSRLARISAYDSITMIDLVSVDDATLFTPKKLLRVFKAAKLTIINDKSVEDLRSAVVRLGLQEEKWVRPSWDAYFMEMADLASLRSNCMKRSVGAILVNDKRVVATGYNGTASGLVNCRNGGCPRCNGNARCGVGLDHCFCLHAEENALLEAGRVRSGGATIYCTTAPCLGCSQKIIQCGVVRVVYRKDYSIEHNAQAMMSTVGLELVKFVDPTPSVE